jgi:5-methylcytosine-specific restriction endonuclease McrA
VGFSLSRYNSGTCYKSPRAAETAGGMAQGGKSLSDADSTTRTCTKCGCTFPATAEFFHRGGKGKTGLGARCKACVRAYHRSIVDRERLPERVAYKAANAKANRETYNARRRAWRAEHPEEKLAYDRAYRAANPDKMSAYDRNRRAREQSAEGTHTAEDIRAQYDRQKGKCFWCHKKLGKYHVDHVVPIARGGSNGPENLVVACPHCNHTKSAKHPMDFAGILL